MTILNNFWIDHLIVRRYKNMQELLYEHSKSFEYNKIYPISSYFILLTIANVIKIIIILVFISCLDCYGFSSTMVS